MTKRILSIILTLVIISCAIIPTLVVGAASVTSWEWNSDDNNEGWVINENISSGTVENGYFTLDIIGDDAYVTGPEVSFSATTFKSFEITYRNSAENTNAEIFWTCSDGGWSPERCMGFSTIADGEWHTATVDVSQSEYWTGIVTQLRIDPTQEGSGIFEIDSLRFIPDEDCLEVWNFGVNNNFENWEPNSHVSSCDVTDGSLNVKASGLLDPNVFNESVTLDTSIYKKLVITYRNNTDGTLAQFYWAELGESWSEERAIVINTVNDGDWHTVTFDLSNDADWSGTVKAIRFDPVMSASGTFEIDKIALGSPNAPLHFEATDIASAKSWNWTKDGDDGGWSEYANISSSTVKDGSVSFTVSNATDPYVYSPEITLDTSVYKQIEIVYRSTIADNDARIYWKTENTGFSQADSYGFEIKNNEDWNTCILDLSSFANWTGVLSRLRFDFTGSGTGIFEIDRFRLISTTDSTDSNCTVKAGDTTSWNWRTDDDYLGWTLNSAVANWDVAHGNMVMYINGSDPNATSPAFSVDASKYTIVEIKYKNEINNDEGCIYWTGDDRVWSEAKSYEFTTIADGKWHTIRLDLSDCSEWKGNITQLRIDPTTGGTGHFFIDRVALMDAPSRYTMSNGYIYLSGVNGAIDTMHFDPNGTASYGENLLMGELFMELKYNGTTYSSSGSNVNWTINNNTLTINNIKFGNIGITGKWVVTINGNKLDNKFVITSAINSNVTLNDLGYCYDMVWDNDGYDVEAEPKGSLRVPFTKMVSSDDRYHSAYAFKRMPSTEDPSTIGFTGVWTDWEGANGYDYNLRFSYDTARISPICYVDYLRFQFRDQNSSVSMASGSSLTRTLGIEVSQNGDITPEHFVSFEGADTEVATALNEMLYEFGNARERTCCNPDWAEWISVIRAWQDDNYLQPEKAHVTNYYQTDEGYVHTWGSNPGWPFPTDRDANHYITTCANLINSVYNYYVYDGDETFLNNNLSRIRLAIDYLLAQFDSNYNLFRISQADHNGTSKSVGSNYWDIVPYGNLSAYDNIYGYLAVSRMAEIEKMLGNTSRATELEDYANKLKIAYNDLFWAGDHYIQCIDTNNEKHDYGSVYLNLEAITYGLADDARAKEILDFMSNTVTSSGEADVFSEFVFAPRATMFHNPSWEEGGWYCCLWPGGDAFGSEQIQNGGTIFYITYYELMSRLKAYGADNTYERLKEIVDRFNIEHLQGGGVLATGEKNQHPDPGLVGCWGEFPENGLVPIAAKNGFMGIDADIDGLHITPEMPSTGMTSLTVNKMNYWGMSLNVTTTANSVRIQAEENNSNFTDWAVNGKRVNGLFDITVDISEGETVTLSRDADADVGYYTVTFEAGENGTLSGETSVAVENGTELSSLTFPTATANDGYEFIGWSQTTGTITSDITVTAQYSKITYQTGDVNRDDEVTISDATAIQKMLVHLIKFDEEQTLLADADGNGYVSIRDVTYIQMYIAKMIDSLANK